jgi:hypothetical protein
MHRIRLSRRELLLGGAALAAAAPAVAQSPSGAKYFVEVLVFRQPGNAPAATVMTLPESGASTPGRVTPLPQTDWQLGNLDAGLRRRSGYAVLGHAAWLATVPANGSVTARLEDLSVGNGVTGAVTVQRGQYLFLRVEVKYATPEGGVHELRERRRIKFNEKHYFDHPAIGAIAIVSPTGG